MRFLINGAAALALGLFTYDPATAECTKPLTLVTSVDMAPIKDNRAVVVPVTLGGKPKLLLVDTGGAVTEMTPQAADELALTRARTGMQLFDVAGHMSNQFVHTSLGLGVLTARDMVFMVSPGNDPISDDADVAGILGPDIMQHYDVDIDFGTGKFNLLSQDHCEGKVLYWKADAVAVVPMRLMDSGHIQLQVILDGQPVTAMLDTGAYNTTLTTLVAEGTFGLKPGSAEMPQTGQLPDRPVALTYHHVFKSLGFEGIAVNNPDIDIIPDFLKQVATENATPDTGSHLVTPKSNETAQAMLLGMDVLRHFHFYIAYKENKVYITPATAPASP